MCNIFSGPQGVAYSPAVPLILGRILATKAQLTGVSGHDRRAKSINPMYYTGNPVPSLKEKVIKGKFGLVSCACYEVSSSSLLSMRIKAFEALLPVSDLGEAISPFPWKCCGKTEYTGRALDPQHSAVDVQLAMLDAQSVQPSDL